MLQEISGHLTKRHPLLGGGFFKTNVEEAIVRYGVVHRDGSDCTTLSAVTGTGTTNG